MYMCVTPRRSRRCILWQFSFKKHACLTELLLVIVPIPFELQRVKKKHRVNTVHTIHFALFKITLECYENI